MHKEEANAITAMFLIFTGISFFSGFCLGHILVGNEFRKEAVKNKVAHWTVDENGCVKFEWNTPTESFGE